MGHGFHGYVKQPEGINGVTLQKTLGDLWGQESWMVPGWYPEIVEICIYIYIYIHIYIYILMPQNMIIIDFDPRPILFKKRLAFDRCLLFGGCLPKWIGQKMVNPKSNGLSSSSLLI